MVNAVWTGRHHVYVVDRMSRYRTRTKVSGFNGDRELPFVADFHEDYNVSTIFLYLQQNQEGFEVHGGE